MFNAVPTPLIHDIRTQFDVNLYVEREQELAQAQAWQRNTTKRVLTVTGPPAQGKSWFLANFHRLLNETYPSFTLDITQFLHPGPLGNREINPIALHDWLIVFVAVMREKCRSIPTINDIASVAANLSNLSEYVGLKCWPNNPIYLFVDGGDEPSKNAFMAIEKEILEPIMKANSNWKLVIALREEQQLFSYLLRNTEQRLKMLPLSNTERNTHRGLDQLARLIANHPPPIPNRDQIIAMLPGYPWSHPGLNTFLFEEARTTLAEDNKPRPREQLLKRGISALIKINESEEATTLVNWLIQVDSLVGNPDIEWTVENLTIYLNGSRSEAWAIINSLRKYQLILNINNRYKIVDGVREFVQIARTLE